LSVREYKQTRKEKNPEIHVSIFKKPSTTTQMSLRPEILFCATCTRLKNTTFFGSADNLNRKRRHEAAKSKHGAVVITV